MATQNIDMMIDSEDSHAPSEIHRDSAPCNMSQTTGVIRALHQCHDSEDNEDEPFSPDAKRIALMRNRAPESDETTRCVEKLTEGTSSAVKPAADLVVAFYNIGWNKERFWARNHHEQEEFLSRDIRTALAEYVADLVLLSECGVIGEGFDSTLWLPMLHRICHSHYQGPLYEITCHSHYTCIVNTRSVEVTQRPSLRGPMTAHPDHEFRMCQHLAVKLKDTTTSQLTSSAFTHRLQRSVHDILGCTNTSINGWQRHHNKCRHHRR